MAFKECPRRGTRRPERAPGGLRRVRLAGYAAAVASIRVLPRVVRHVWRSRERLERQRDGLVSELATAIDSVLNAHVLGRSALTAYRLAMRTLLVAAILFVLAGAALAAGLRDSTIAVVVGIALAVGGCFLGWQWWTWSIGLRFLKQNVDPARQVPPASSRAASPSSRRRRAPRRRRSAGSWTSWAARCGTTSDLRPPPRVVPRRAGPGGAAVRAELPPRLAAQQELHAARPLARAQGVAVRPGQQRDGVLGDRRQRRGPGVHPGPLPRALGPLAAPTGAAPPPAPAGWRR